MKMSELEVKIQQRRKFVARVLNFVERLLVQKGTIVSRDESSDHIHVVRCLVNFADFSFYYSCGETYCGGNTVKVWYHPGAKKTAEDVADFSRDNPVLNVHYDSLRLDTTGDKVDLFDKEIAWQDAIRQVIKGKRRILADQKRVEKQAILDARARHNAEVHRERTSATAARLGV
jgi:hypothetical protein